MTDWIKRGLLRLPPGTRGKKKALEELEVMNARVMLAWCVALALDDPAGGTFQGPHWSSEKWRRWSEAFGKGEYRYERGVRDF